MDGIGVGDAMEVVRGVREKWSDPNSRPDGWGAAVPDVLLLIEEHELVGYGVTSSSGRPYLLFISYRGQLIMLPRDEAAQSDNDHIGSSSYCVTSVTSSGGRVYTWTSEL
jgi:hypothetical protein